jgi:hypothetical protein
MPANARLRLGDGADRATNQRTPARPRRRNPPLTARGIVVGRELVEQRSGYDWSQSTSPVSETVRGRGSSASRHALVAIL